MIAISGREDEIRTRLGERSREILTEAPTSSGYNRDSAGEVERITVICRGRVVFRSHDAAPGVRTTFIRLGSRLCSRSNHRGPSSSGAIAVINGFTRIACEASNSMAFGYSPEEAQDP